MRPLYKRFIFVLVAVSVAVLSGLLIEALISFVTGWPFGHTQNGHLLGWLGFLAMLAGFGYSIKKRFDRKSGWPKVWFWVHQSSGVLAPLLILVHAGPHFHALVPAFALAAMIVVAISGLTGVIVHRKAISLMNAERAELRSQGLSRSDVESRLFDLASQEETFRLWQLIHVPMVMLFLVLVICHIGGALYFGGM